MAIGHKRGGGLIRGERDLNHSRCCIWLTMREKKEEEIWTKWRLLNIVKGEHCVLFSFPVLSVKAGTFLVMRLRACQRAYSNPWRSWSSCKCIFYAHAQRCENHRLFWGLIKRLFPSFFDSPRVSEWKRCISRAGQGSWSNDKSLASPLIF